MAFEQNDMNGALWRNDKKQEGDRRPDYRGNAKIHGVDMWVSAWLKKDRNGGTYMSLAFEDKERRTEHPNRTEAEATRPIAEELDDSMPF